jgi:hypothetical protein
LNGKTLTNPGGRCVVSGHEPGKLARGDLPNRRGSAAQAGRRFAAGLAKDAAKVRFVGNMRRRLGQEREEKHS